MNNKIFILGCPRSGTTLLSQLLADTDFGAPVESHFITKYFKKLHSYRDLSEKGNFVQLMGDILAERPIMQWKIDLDLDCFYSEMKEYSYSEIVNQLFLRRAEKKNKNCWGDKTPHYILDVDIIYSLFPEAKYLHIIRDGRDVALSLLENSWGPNNIFECANYWRKSNLCSETMKIMKERKQVFFLRYEDLLDAPEKLIVDILDFLQQEHTSQNVVKLASTINRSNFDKWKMKLSSLQIKLFENIAADVLSENGYETSYKIEKVNLVFVLFYRMLGFWQRILFLFNHNVIDGFKIKFFNKEPFAE